MSTVDVVIPTYNRRALVVRCIASLRRQTRPPDRIIVVDDGSVDDTVTLLCQALPWVETIARPMNGGFAAAANTGLRSSTGDFVALLNNDAIAEPGWLAALVAAASADPALGSCASKMVFADRPGIVNSTGIFVRPSGGARDIGYGEPDGPAFERDREVIGGSGGALLLTRRALESVGLLDEDLIAYEEDVDWALRAQRAGFRCRFVAAARVRHAAHTTYGVSRSRTAYLQSRNLPLIPIKNFPIRLLLTALPQILAINVYQLCRLSWLGLPGPALRGKLSAIRAAPRFWRKRRSWAGKSDAGFADRLKALSR